MTYKNSAQLLRNYSDMIKEMQNDQPVVEADEEEIDESKEEEKEEVDEAKEDDSDDDDKE